MATVSIDPLIELGILGDDERIELIGGQMIVAEPKGSPHQAAIGLTAETMRSPGRSPGRTPPSPSPTCFPS